MNNNKTMGLQPGRISGGAAKMIQDHYSAGPLKPETAAEKAARLAAEKKSMEALKAGRKLTDVYEEFGVL